jgi:hypothetical protein
VRFAKGVQTGRGLQRLNEHIVNKLSPWGPGAFGARLNWVLRREEVESWLREVDGVESVARVSMLQISEDDDRRYWLADSAREEPPAQWWKLAPSASGGKHTLRARYPWSIAIPTRHHRFDLVADTAPAAAAGSQPATAAEEAKATGIDRLEIGNSFIIIEQARRG